MFPGCYNANGQLRVQLAVPPVGASFNHGVACGKDFVYVGSAAPDGFVNGLPILADGRMSMTLAGTTDHYSNGIPFTQVNQVSCIDSALPDHYQNGLPFVGDKIPVEVVPVAVMSSFSNGFNAGAFA